MKPKSSSGYDCISNLLLEKLVNVLKVPLAYIFNLSLEMGVFPDLMKIVKVLPLFKTGDSTTPNNYRPISLLPVISKVLEKIVYNKSVDYLESNQGTYSKQFGLQEKALNWRSGNDINC